MWKTLCGRRFSFHFWPLPGIFRASPLVRASIISPSRLLAVLRAVLLPPYNPLCKEQPESNWRICHQFISDFSYKLSRGSRALLARSPRAAACRPPKGLWGPVLAFFSEHTLYHCAALCSGPGADPGSGGPEVYISCGPWGSRKII